VTLVVERPVTPGAICYLIEHMRERDAREIFALRWDDDPVTLAHELTAYAGDLWRVWDVDGKPAAMAGVTPLRPGVVRLGAFGTDNWTRAVPSVLRWSWRWALPRLAAAGYHRGEAYALATNEDGRRFIEALDGEIEALLQGYGRGGEDFLLYAWRLQDVHRRRALIISGSGGDRPGPVRSSRLRRHTRSASS
jgi:hypothetical protein